MAVDERESFLATISAEDPELGAAVADLLRLTEERDALLVGVGEGGLGEVRLAYDETLDRRVALKFPKATLLGDPSVRHRLRREARVAECLRHVAVCSSLRSLVPTRPTRHTWGSRKRLPARS